MNIQEYINLGEEKAIRVDFARFTKGDADGGALMLKIYEDIFPEYEKKYTTQGWKTVGDTLNTYKLPILEKFYVKELKNDGIRSVKKIKDCHPTLHNGIIRIIKEYDPLAEKISNNHQLGNFSIVPLKDGFSINSLRAVSSGLQLKYNDFFDLYLIVIDGYCQGKLNNNNLDKLQEGVIANKDYYNQFSDLNDYINRNYLNAFYEQIGEERRLIKLSECKNFEEYVIKINNIIEVRGRKLFRILKEKYKKGNDE